METELNYASTIASTMPNRAEILNQKFQNSLALPFEQVLATEVIQQILGGVIKLLLDV